MATSDTPFQLTGTARQLVAVAQLILGAIAAALAAEPSLVSPRIVSATLAGYAFIAGAYRLATPIATKQEPPS